MATDWQVLGSAIYSRLTSVTGAGTVAIYQDMAPQPTLAPYFVFSRLAGFDEYSFDKRGFSFRYMFKAVSNQESAHEAETIYSVYEPYIQDAPLSMTGYRLIHIRRAMPLHYPDGDGFWNCGGEYEISMWRL